MPNLFEKIAKGLRESKFTVVELKELSQIAPNLKQAWDSLLKQKQKSLKPCTLEQRSAIEEFMTYIGHEITPAQPDEETLAELMAVPKHIKKLLLSLVPYAKEPLLTLLYSKARPFENLNEILSWLYSLDDLYNKLACQKYPPTQKRFFNQIFDFTDKVGLDYATICMKMVLAGEFSLDELKPFFEDLASLQPILSRRTNFYEPIFYEEGRIVDLLEENHCAYLTLLNNHKSGSSTPSVSQDASFDYENNRPMITRTKSAPVITTEENNFRASRPLASQ